MLPLFDQEEYYGNIEYKLIINYKKKERLLSQFLFRMREGNGKAIYIIGIHDSGQLYFQNIKYVLVSVLQFIKIVKPYCSFKVKFFTYSSYVYSILYLYNNNIIDTTNSIDYNKFI